MKNRFSGQMSTVSQFLSFVRDHDIWPEQCKSFRRLSWAKEPRLLSTFQHSPWEITAFRPKPNGIESSSPAALLMVVGLGRNIAIVFGDGIRTN